MAGAAADCAVGCARHLPLRQRSASAGLFREILRFGFEELHLHRVNVDTRMGNTASVRLMARLGFKQEGVRREGIQNENGTYQNWGLFGMLEEEYAARQSP